MNKRPNTRDVHARQHAAPAKYSLLRLIGEHFKACFSSLGRLGRAPFASLLTIAVIGIALALPVGMFVALKNIFVVGQHWDNGAQISLYVKKNTSQVQINHLLTELKTRSGIRSIKYISPKQGLAEFKKQSNFGDALNELPENPLPGVIEVEPNASLDDPFVIKQLLSNLKMYPQVDSAVLDMQWVMRLNSILHIARRSIWAISILLGLAVLLVIGNTIRLVIENYRREIEVVKLVGATDAFVRRDFLYIGIFYGLFGGLIAWLLVDMVMDLLKGPVRDLAMLYNNQFHLLSIDAHVVWSLLITAGSLGFAGAWLAVAKHLNAIEPE